MEGLRNAFQITMTIIFAVMSLVFAIWFVRDMVRMKRKEKNRRL